MKRILTGLAIALVTSVFAYAQATMTGKWQGETPSGNQVALDLKATAAALSGTLTEGTQTLTISEGAVSKNTFTFKVTLGERTEGFTGEVAGDQITIWMDRQGPSRAAVLKRVKN